MCPSMRVCATADAACHALAPPAAAAAAALAFSSSSCSFTAASNWLRDSMLISPSRSSTCRFGWEAWARLGHMVHLEGAGMT